MPRPDMSEERIQQIIEAALTVFARQGFAQARMEDIAHVAGLSKAALYLYFKSKDAIIAAILKVFFRQEMRFLRMGIAPGQSASDQLWELVRQIGNVLEHMKPLLPIAFEFYAIAGRRQDVRQFLFEFYEDYVTMLAATIEQGIARGEFRPVDVRSVAVAIIALLEGLVLLWMLSPTALEWNTQAESAMQLVLSGLSPSS